MANFKFTSAEKEKVSEAIRNLELESSGEIVPYIAKRSDDYDEAKWFSAVYFLGASLIIEVILSYLWLLPGFFTPMISSLISLGFGVVGYLIPTLFPRTRLIFISDERMMERVGEKALEVFVDEEVFNTRERTGILIFVSRLEHKVLVLGDSGINAKVEQTDWTHVVDIIINGIKTDKVIDGLSEAINACKKLLLDNGFVVRPDDTNELSDELRIEE